MVVYVTVKPFWTRGSGKDPLFFTLLILCMGITGTAKKLQALSDLAETLYEQVQELQRRTTALETAVDDTHETVTEMDQQLAEQRELLLALADEHGLDGEAILADAAATNGQEGQNSESGENEST